MVINKDVLLKCGWTETIDPVILKMPEEEKQRLKSEGINISDTYYEITVYDINCNEVFLTMRNDISNSLNRNWNCHADNNFREGIGSCDISTIGQFNKFMDLLDIDYRIGVPKILHYFWFGKKS